MVIRKIKEQLLYRRIFLLIIDCIVITVACLGGLLIRYDFNYGNIDTRFLETVKSYYIINVIITIIIFFLFKLYHSLWIYASARELQNVFGASAVAVILMFTGMTVLGYPIPRSYYLIYGALLFLLTMSNRFFYRFVRSYHHSAGSSSASRNVMIIGGGDAASMIIKEIQSSVHIHNEKVQCIIDDDLMKQGRYIHGVQIKGTRKNILEYVALYEIHEIIIAMPSSTKIAIREIVNICKETKCELKILPGIYQLMNGEVSVHKLRKVEIEDLLGRDPIAVDLYSIMGYVKGKVLLVTGGGGSIGSELCRQLAKYEPKQLIIIDNYENNAYNIQQELKMLHPELNLLVLIATVRDAVTMKQIFRTYKPDIVYHAAAHKHVPLMEASPKEAIKNNVIGTLNTVIAADQSGVERFVMISTDKAVNPTNVMGATKRICEMIIQAYNKRSKTEFVAVRFGNVLGSNGSVIPLFKKQIDAGGPVTVTHPDIIRYFMTIPEAVSLVLQAGAYAKGGEIFILDMGEPMKILDLAQNLIRMCGYEPNEDIKIEFTGLRPGEKLYEEMLMAEEGMKETANKLIHIGKAIEFDDTKFFDQIEELRVACQIENLDVRKLIQEIVPTYVNQNEMDHIVETIETEELVSVGKQKAMIVPNLEYANAGAN